MKKYDKRDHVIVVQHLRKKRKKKEREKERKKERKK